MTTYNRRQIAWELERTAVGDGFFGNALRVAKDIPGVTAEERSLLDRYATGTDSGTDHVALQTLALRLYRAAPITVSLTGAGGVPAWAKYRLMDALGAEMLKTYDDLADEAAAIDKILTEPWCPSGALARQGKWESTKRKALEAACARMGVSPVGLDFTINGR